MQAFELAQLISQREAANKLYLEFLRECLKTCKKEKSWANLWDDQISTNLPN